jgi:hypothetical protein
MLNGDRANGRVFMRKGAYCATKIAVARGLARL